MNCYNCGKPVSNDSQVKKNTSKDVVLKNHVEHVPAICFYVGAKEEHKINRITVPACFTCNNQYSGIDDELRNMIGVANDSMDEGEILTDKSIRAIVRKNNWHERVHMNEDRTVGSVTFDANKVYNIYRKNFKALIYHEYNIVINDDFKIAILFDGFKLNTNTGSMTGGKEQFERYLFTMTKLLMDVGTWKPSGHKDIFEYGLLPLSYNEEKIIVPESNPDKAVTFLMMQVYHQKIESVIAAINVKKSLMQQAASDSNK